MWSNERSNYDDLASQVCTTDSIIYSESHMNKLSVAGQMTLTARVASPPVQWSLNTLKSSLKYILKRCTTLELRLALQHKCSNL